MANTYNELDEWAQIEIDEVLESIFYKGYEACIEDERGCNMGASWVSPKKVAEALSDLACRLSDDG